MLRLVDCLMFTANSSFLVRLSLTELQEEEIFVQDGDFVHKLFHLNIVLL